MFLIVLGIFLFILTVTVIKNHPVLEKFTGTGRLIALLMIV